jgi:hypothetical protein
MTIILIESFDLDDLREYECMVCLETPPRVGREMADMCQFPFHEDQDY